MNWQSLIRVIGAAGLLAATLFLSGCDTGGDEPNFHNPLDPAQGAGLPVPGAVTVTVGDNVALLQWAAPEQGEIDEYAIFRRQTNPDEGEDEALITRVTATTYSDPGVRNGRVYAYRLASGSNGQFGPRTDEIEARPGLYLIMVANNDEFTSTRDVQISFSGAGAEAIRLSEDAEEFISSWQPATGTIPWTLSAGDGDKTVYAEFRLVDGSETTPVFDAITLDTKATISSFDFDGDATRQPGDTIHFRLTSGEQNGAATVTVLGVFDDVPLYDDGTGGDATAGDGTYERDLIIPASARVSNERALGSFMDEAGNYATVLDASRFLTVYSAPAAVEMLDPRVEEPPENAGVSLRWTKSSADGFHAYRIYRSEGATVDSTDRLIETALSINNQEYTDWEVAEGHTYLYRIYVQDDLALETGSNTVTAEVPNVRPPTYLSLRTPTAVSTSRIALAWDETADLDFEAYRLYRNETGTVSEEDELIVEVTGEREAFWDDEGLTENTTYHYRLYTYDEAGLFTRSNEIEATTSNEAPSAVTLNAATGIDSTSADLSWTQSNAHDFAYYRLYRDEIEAVSTASTFVGELDSNLFLGFHDDDLSSGTRYYYRVFVVDDASDPEATGSNTITFVTPESARGGP